MPLVDFFRRGSKKNQKKPGQKDQSVSTATGGETSSKPAVKHPEESKRDEVCVDKAKDTGKNEKSPQLKKNITNTIPQSLEEDGNSSIVGESKGQDVKETNSNEKYDTQVTEPIPLLDEADTYEKDRAGNKVTDIEGKISSEIVENIPEQSEIKEISEVTKEQEKIEDGNDNINTEEQKNDFPEKKVTTNDQQINVIRLESTTSLTQENIKSAQTMIEIVQEKIESVQEAIESVQEKNESAQETIANIQEIESAQERVESAQERVESAQERVESAQERVESAQERVESAQERVESSQERVESATEKIETATQSIGVYEEAMTNESIDHTETPKSLDESQFVEKVAQVNEKAENCLPELSSTVGSGKPAAEAEIYSDVEKQNESTDDTAKKQPLECDINSNIVGYEPNVDSYKYFSPIETEAQYPSDKNEMQKVSNDTTVVQSHAHVLEPVEESTIKSHSTNTADEISVLKENVFSEENVEEKILDVAKDAIENINEKEENYVQLNLESFESQSMGPETNAVGKDTEEMLSKYFDLSEKIVSESLAEAFEELNLMFFDTDETNNADGDKDDNESNEENNDEGGKENNEDGDENNNGGGDENNNGNGNENQTENNEHVSLRKQDSGVASTDSEDMVENVVFRPPQLENNSNQKWKVGYLQVKLPSKSRGKTKLKAWEKRWVVVQNDEFTRDRKNCFLMLSIYHSESGNSRRHSALFWRSVSSKKAVVYRSMSRTQPYAFTVADETGPLLHLANKNETESQEWMTAIRNILWPPNPVLQLEKVLNGNEFDISFVDNEFSHRAGLLGTYGCLMVTNRKLILNHPQTGHVIQEWYLNTVDKFQIVPQPKEEDTNKVLVMHTSSDSSTGCGELRIFCNDAVAFLKSLAATIHKVLQYHSRGNSGRYEKELEEVAEWLVPQTPQGGAEGEDYYKVPKRQVRSLLDIPNFIFDKPICEATISYDLLPTSSSTLSTSKLTTSYTSISTFSQDSGILTATSSSDFLNCNQTLFSIGGSEIRRQGKRYQSSSSESSEGYSPPYSPITVKRLPRKENIGKLQEVHSEDS